MAANPKLLTDIANATGGSSYDLNRLPALIDELVRGSSEPVQARQVSVPLSNTVRAVLSLAGKYPGWDKKYDMPTQGALVVALLAVEWIFRRRWQLP